MIFYVYLIVTKNKNRLISYVGYTNNLKKRVKLHNDSKGAKFTKGRSWKLAYYQTYKTKSVALKQEYKLKKDYNLRSRIKKKYLDNENISSSSL
ncbi:GIY-YIG nuclease family protein [Pelagibacterales bacterium SAG-MED01]|nr:GIY-YIG nuclease family protein [Pelagibacterales bacterium SAG-MED01]